MGDLVQYQNITFDPQAAICVSALDMNYPVTLKRLQEAAKAKGYAWVILYSEYEQEYKFKVRLKTVGDEEITCENI